MLAPFPSTAATARGAPHASSHRSCCWLACAGWKGGRAKQKGGPAAPATGQVLDEAPAAVVASHGTSALDTRTAADWMRTRQPEAFLLSAEPPGAQPGAAGPDVPAADPVSALEGWGVSALGGDAADEMPAVDEAGPAMVPGEDGAAGVEEGAPEVPADGGGHAQDISGVNVEAGLSLKEGVAMDMRSAVDEEGTGDEGGVVYVDDTEQAAESESSALGNDPQAEEPMQAAAEEGLPAPASFGEGDKSEQAAEGVGSYAAVGPAVADLAPELSSLPNRIADEEQRVALHEAAAKARSSRESDSQASEAPVVDATAGTAEPDVAPELGRSAEEEQQVAVQEAAVEARSSEEGVSQEQEAPVLEQGTPHSDGSASQGSSFTGGSAAEPAPTLATMAGSLSIRADTLEADVQVGDLHEGPDVAGSLELEDGAASHAEEAADAGVQDAAAAAPPADTAGGPSEEVEQPGNEQAAASEEAAVPTADTGSSSAAPSLPSPAKRSLTARASKKDQLEMAALRVDVRITQNLLNGLPGLLELFQACWH